jgi:osmotically-inducible protein OsmY
MMSRKNRRNERDWTGSDQGSFGRREDENSWNRSGQERPDWRNEDYSRRRGQDMDPGWSGERQKLESGGGQRWRRESPDWDRERNVPGERRDWGRDTRDEWERRSRGWDRGSAGWQGGRGAGSPGERWQGGMPEQAVRRDYGSQHRRGEDEDWNDRYAGLGGRGWREGWDDAMHRGSGQYAGRGPRNYQRQDSRIEEDINERLTEHPMIDATDIEVTVLGGEVTLRGQVNRREDKRMAEDIAECVFGVKEVNNQIKVKQQSWGDTKLDKAG